MVLSAAKASIGGYNRDILLHVSVLNLHRLKMKYEICTVQCDAK